MSPFFGRGPAPDGDWFQIGEVPERQPPRRRGSGRVSLSAMQDEPDVATAAATRAAALARANTVAGAALGRLHRRPLAICGLVLVVVVIAVLVIVSTRHSAPSSSTAVHHHRARPNAPASQRPSAAVLDRDLAHVTRLKRELRAADRKLHAARTELARSRHATARHTATRRRRKERGR